ncbi:helix-turn-helix transcriptional regulator [Dactylosporangium sp. NPDC051485]|uniref:helix-turn-helix domain-containing protein n=1 Tax=Dactylosporangium sp. NPDC051485 TaxID=3154846 RepID=UPI00343BB2B5
MSADERAGERLASLLRDRRQALGYTLAHVVAESGVSESAIKRYERGLIESPNPAQIVAICKVLGINPREAAIAVGFGTREDFGLPPEEPPYPEVIRQLGRALTDEQFTVSQRAALEHALRGAFEAWQMALSATPGDTPGVRRR